MGNRGTGCGNSWATLGVGVESIGFIVGLGVIFAAYDSLKAVFLEKSGK